MRLFTRSVILTFIITSMIACAQQPALDLSHNSVNHLDVKNLNITSKTSMASGQPTQEQLAALADMGIKHVINLRPDSETDWDEKSVVEGLNMEYHLIPVPGKPGITIENAKKLDELLQQLEGEPLLLHCSSSNRVGSLIALAEYHVRGADIETALAKGRDYGLTRLEPMIREKLSK